MTLDEQQRVFESYSAHMHNIMFRKGNDYATDADRLDNFKNVARITGTTPQLACLNLIATKVARLGNLLQPGKTANNESVEDSMTDLSVYSVLLTMIQKEANEESNREKVCAQPREPRA